MVSSVVEAIHLHATGLVDPGEELAIGEMTVQTILCLLLDSLTEEKSNIVLDLWNHYLLVLLAHAYAQKSGGTTKKKDRKSLLGSYLTTQSHDIRDRTTRSSAGEGDLRYS